MAINAGEIANLADIHFEDFCPAMAKRQGMAVEPVSETVHSRIFSSLGGYSIQGYAIGRGAGRLVALNAKPIADQ